MDAHTALQRVEEFAARLGLVESDEPWKLFELLTRDEQRELVTIARRFGVALDAGLTEHSPMLTRERKARREAVDRAQALQLRVDLLTRAGDLLASSCQDSEARTAWEEAKP